jgi:hypothetical protein
MPVYVNSHPPRLEVPRNVIVPVIEAVDQQDIPAFHIGNEGKLEPLMKPFVRVYSDFVKKIGASKVTVENLTDLFLQYSQEKDKQWPREPLELIAKFFVNRDIPPYRRGDELNLERLIEPFERMHLEYMKVIGADRISVNVLCDLFVLYSQARDMRWPLESLQLIAQYIIERDIPAYRKEGLVMLEPLVQPCAKLCLDFAKKVGASKVTVENLTDSLLEYSQSRGKGWEREHLKRIAKVLVEGHNLDSPPETPRKNDSSSGSHEKK